MKFPSTILLVLLGSSTAHPLRKGIGSEPCPFLLQNAASQQQPPSMERLGRRRNLQAMSGVPEGGFEAVMTDIKTLLTDDSQYDFWPADFGNYGGLFIRLAWHCSGSYREHDGRGGCDGGRIRFDPELNWDDNANLDKALTLLEPIKEKYGDVLSWGDLIILAGTAAIEGMGGPVLGFCGGRIDDPDGAASIYLGPSQIQEDIAPCLSVNKNGQCLDVEGTAMGPTTMELIYVNPGGPVDGTGDPIAAGADIRKAFARMGFNDTESVALIGGGHAFGKCHGPCMDPPCGVGTDMEGKGNYTWTSGFEGVWTTRPTEWTNQYFTNLFEYNWTLTSSPAGNPQFETDDNPDVFMLVTDVAMGEDELYRPISELYAADIRQLETDFAHAWYRLTTADRGPATKCIGENIPEPQWWQFPLPASPDTLPDYIPIRSAIQGVLEADDVNVQHLIDLAYRASYTYRSTDYRGGVNGARIRFEPESGFDGNEMAAEALALLEPVKVEFPDASYADLIVLSGIAALEYQNEGLMLSFCGGYVDADSGDGSMNLEPRNYSTPLITIRDDCAVKGLTADECVAMVSRHNVTSQFYADLLAGMGDMYELVFVESDELRPIVEEFSTDEDALKAAFSSAWNYMMTADRYLDYYQNACTGVSIATLEGEESVGMIDDTGMGEASSTEASSTEASSTEASTTEASTTEASSTEPMASGREDEEVQTSTSEGGGENAGSKGDQSPITSTAARHGYVIGLLALVASFAYQL